MSNELKSELENIAQSLTTPILPYYGSMYISVIQEGIWKMTGGKIIAKPVSENGKFLMPERIDSNNLHNTYALFYDNQCVGQIFIDSWPWVSGDGLTRAVEVSLMAYPTDKTVIIGRGLTAFHNVHRDTTKYDNIFLGPSLSF